MKTKFAKRFLVAIAVVACISAFCVLGACGTSVAGTYTYDYVNGFAQEETAQFVLDKDGTATLTFPGAEFLASDKYVGTYTNDGTTVTIEGLYEEDGASNYPGLWTTWIDSTNGNCKIEVDKKAGTFTPYFFETTDTTEDTTDETDGEDTTDLIPPTMPAEGATPTAIYETTMIAITGAEETVELALYDGGICTLEDVASGTMGPVALTYYGTYVTITETATTSIYVSDLKDEDGNPIPGDEQEYMNFSFVTNCGFKATLTDAADSESNGTFTVIAQVGTYTYTETSVIGATETHSLVLYADATCTLQNLDTLMPQLGGVYYGTYSIDSGDSASITVSTLTDANGSYILGVDNPDSSLGFNMNFSYVKGYGFTATLDGSAGSFTPAEVTADSAEEE